ncbi:hypothetical protein [Deinococcus misasensis]|uniref:hypothetical protein n=1 Tax=Deinococcus misasensis TaxID=392413 RepID=UPI00055057C7|nr:hypothetical protein [Deinococcus misasensis]
MHAYQNSVVVKTTPQELWALWANPAGWSSWDADIEKASSESVLRIGSTGKLTTVRGSEHTFKVLLCDPGSSLMISYQYNMGVELNIKRSWEKVSDGIKVTQEVTLIGPMAIFTHRLRKEQFVQMTNQTLQKLKDHLEGTGNRPAQVSGRPTFT